MHFFRKAISRNQVRVTAEHRTPRCVRRRSQDSPDETTASCRQIDRIEHRLDTLPSNNDDSIVTRRRRSNVEAYITAGQLGAAKYELQQLARRLDARFPKQQASF